MINKAPAYAKLKYSYSIKKPFLPLQNGPKPLKGGTKTLFPTCGPGANTSSLFYTTTEVSLTNILEKTDAESCTNTLTYHAKTINVTEPAKIGNVGT